MSTRRGPADLNHLTPAEQEEMRKNVRYWRITIDLGEGVVENMGGTVFSEEQAREQASMWLHHYANQIAAGEEESGGRT